MSKQSVDLYRRRLLQGTTAFFCLSVSRIGFPATTYLVAVRVWPSSTYTRITLESNAPLRYTSFMLQAPNRLIIDLKNLQLNTTLQQIAQLIRNDDPFLHVARVGQFDPQTVRLVLELKQKVNPEIFTLKPISGFLNRLVIDLYPSESLSSDPLLALLKEYNQGDLNLEGGSIKQAPKAKRPANPANKPWVVMIDPGHGGEDPGAIGKSKTHEKTIVLQIAKRLKKLIQQRPNMKVLMTRYDDVFIPLRVRVAKARNQRADIFISIHADAFTNRQAHGSSVFILSTKGATSTAARYLATTQNEADSIGGVSKSGDTYLDHTLIDLVQTATINDSLLLGKEVLKRLAKINTLHKNSVEQAGFAVLRAPEIPSILVETAFISNLKEERKLKTAQFQQQIATAIFQGIQAFISDSTIQQRKLK